MSDNKINFDKLMDYVRKNDVDSALLLMSDKLHFEYINNSDIMGYTALHQACVISNSDTNMIELLLQSGADPNVKSICLDWTPLHIVVQIKVGPISIEIVELLLRYGADPNVKDTFKRTPVTFTGIRSDRKTMFSLLFRFGAEPIDEKTQILKLEIDIESFVKTNKDLKQRIKMLELLA